MPKVIPARQRQLARRTLDQRLEVVRSLVPAMAIPRGGWARAIRTLLGMTAEDVARKLDVTPSTVLRLEASEDAGSIQVDSLHRLAAAMDCELVYAFVPRHSLESTVLNQAERRAVAQLKRNQHTMALEQQSISEATAQSALEDAVKAWIDRPGLWNE